MQLYLPLVQTPLGWALIGTYKPEMAEGKQEDENKITSRKPDVVTRQEVIAMVHRADEENKIDIVDSVEDLSQVKMSQAYPYKSFLCM